jgi:hypothetical protein
MKMTGRPQNLSTVLLLLLLLTFALSACQTKTVEVTRIKIMERRVIERVIVTVPVTRIHTVVQTPTPTRGSLVPFNDASDAALSPSPSPVTPTPSAPQANSATTPTPPSSGKETGERMLAATKDMEQTLLSLVQALNSDPLPQAQVIALYDAIQGAPTFSVPEDEAELQSIYMRYRVQVDYVLGQADDLYTHLVKIQSGEAEQTEITPIRLSMARDAASSGTSTVQGLMRELETYLSSQP